MTLKKKKSQFVLNSPRADDEELHKFLEGCVGVIEDCSSYESMCLYKETVENHGKDAWVQHGSGYLQTVGMVAKMPVAISINYNHVQGHKILFYEATSAVVDHRMIREWLDKVMPVTAFRDNDPRKGLNISNAMNFSNVLPR